MKPTPIYPLSDLQRLGYLSDFKEIQCAEALGELFTPGVNYPVRTAMVAVRRSGTKLNLHGHLDQVEWHGQEQVVIVRANDGQERVFADGRLSKPGVRVSLLAPTDRPGYQKDEDIIPCRVDFTLLELVLHFIIPDVPDVAIQNPQAFHQYLERLEEIESLCL